MNAAQIVRLNSRRHGIHQPFCWSVLRRVAISLSVSEHAGRSYRHPLQPTDTIRAISNSTTAAGPVRENANSTFRTQMVVKKSQVVPTSRTVTCIFTLLPSERCFHRCISSIEVHIPSTRRVPLPPLPLPSPRPVLHIYYRPSHPVASLDQSRS